VVQDVERFDTKLETMRAAKGKSTDERCIEVRRRQGRNWIRDIKRAGETITIHGAVISVDAIYA